MLILVIFTYFLGYVLGYVALFYYIDLDCYLLNLVASLFFSFSCILAILDR